MFWCWRQSKILKSKSWNPNPKILANRVCWNLNLIEKLTQRWLLAAFHWSGSGLQGTLLNHIEKSKLLTTQFGSRVYSIQESDSTGLQNSIVVDEVEVKTGSTLYLSADLVFKTQKPMSKIPCGDPNLGSWYFDCKIDWDLIRQRGQAVFESVAQSVKLRR